MFAHVNRLTNYIHVLLFLLLSLGVAFISLKGPYSGDSVLFWANLKTQSTLHPSGYFWNALISYAFKGFDSSKIIFFIQGLSTFFCLLTISKILKLEKMSTWTATVLALFFIFSFGIFRYLLIYEGRSLAFALTCFFLFFLKLAEQEDLWIHRLLLYFSYVLACSHHHLLFVLCAPVFFSFLYFNRTSLWKCVSLTIYLSILSFLPTLLLPLITRPHLENIYSWGNIQTLHGIWTHWSRSEFGSLQLGHFEKSIFFEGIRTHLLELIRFLIRSSCGLILLFFIPAKSKTSRFQWSLYLGLIIFFLVFILLGSINPVETWYGALLIRFWILPMPLVFISIGLKIKQLCFDYSMSTKFSGLLLAIISIANITMNTWQDYLATQKTIFTQHAEMIAQHPPDKSLVLHTSTIEWIRTTLIFNSSTVPSYVNTNNKTFHILLKSLFHTGWPQEQLLNQLKYSGISSNFDTNEIWLQLENVYSSQGPILVVGPKNKPELDAIKNILDVEVEPAGPYFVVAKKAPGPQKNDFTELIAKGLKQCDDLFTELEKNPLDPWIEPVQDHFCYSCILTAEKTNELKKNKWIHNCPQ